MASSYELQRIKTMVQEERLDDARQALFPILEDPVAQKWLEKINHFSPPDATQTLHTARTMLESKRFTAARAILKTIPDNPTARKWLDKLDEIAPEKEEKPSDTMASRPGEVGGVMQAVGDLLRSKIFQVVYAVSMIAGLGFLLYFWATQPWVDVQYFFSADFFILGTNPETDEDEVPHGEYTAIELLTGSRDGEKFSLETTSFDGLESIMDTIEEGELKPQEYERAPRILDRALALIPVFGVFFAMFCLMLILRGPNKRTSTPIFLMMLFSGFVFGIAMFYQAASEEEWNSNVESFQNEVEEEGGEEAALYFGVAFEAFLSPQVDFEYGTFKIVAGAMVGINLVMWMIYFLEEADFFGKPMKRLERM
jgi:hypothetical protein